MEFTLTTPALLFPALSLIMLAYTNRFVVLAGLIRELTEKQKTHPNQRIRQQIKNLQIRMNYIKNMQIFGALSFIVCVIAMLIMLLQFDYRILISICIFALGLIFLLVSLIFLILELKISVHALSLQLEDLKDND